VAAGRRCWVDNYHALCRQSAVSRKRTVDIHHTLSESELKVEVLIGYGSAGLSSANRRIILYFSLWTDDLFLHRRSCLRRRARLVDHVRDRALAAAERHCHHVSESNARNDRRLKGVIRYDGRIPV
jgi:hypothetical protein